MSRIVYLIGAGASAEAIPTIEKFSAGLKSFKETIAQRRNSGVFQHDLSLADNLQKFFTEKYCGFDLFDGIDQFGSIDTFCKYCYLKDNKSEHDNSLARLKMLITMFFAWNQYVLKNRDKRYFNFITSILEYGNRWPEDVTILSWNYDRLLELANDELYRTEGYSATGQVIVGTPPLVDYFPPVDPTEYVNKKEALDPRFRIVHLNGIADLKKDGNHGKYDDHEFYKGRTTSVMNEDEFLKYCGSRVPFSTHIEFAWEENRTYDLSKTIEDRLNNCEILVVAGYSFPFFNRHLDQLILDKLIEGNGIRKIVVYDTAEKIDERIQNLRSQFPSIGAVSHSEIVNPQTTISAFTDLSRFYIPFEL